MNRTIVNVLCKLYIVFCLLAGIILLAYGVAFIMNNKSGWHLYIILGIAVPLTSVLVTYPLMALANIEKNVEKLNEQIEELTDIIVDKD